MLFGCIGKKFILPILLPSCAITSQFLRFYRNYLFQLLNNDFKTSYLNSVFLPQLVLLSFFFSSFFHFPLNQSSRRLKSFLNFVISLSTCIFQNGSCWAFTDFLIPILSQTIVAPALIRFLKSLISFNVILDISSSSSSSSSSSTSSSSSMFNIISVLRYFGNSGSCYENRHQPDVKGLTAISFPGHVTRQYLSCYSSCS